MQRVSTLTTEQVEDILLDMDWSEIHRLRVFSDYGDSVVLYTDGSHDTQGQSTYYQDPDGAGVIDYLRCWGPGNIDRTVYYEGWCEPTEDGDYIETSTGRILSFEQMVEEAIRDGDWDYDDEREAVLSSLREARANLTCQ